MGDGCKGMSTNCLYQNKDHMYFHLGDQKVGMWNLTVATLASEAALSPCIESLTLQPNFEVACSKGVWTQPFTSTAHIGLGFVSRLKTDFPTRTWTVYTKFFTFTTLYVRRVFANGVDSIRLSICICRHTWRILKIYNSKWVITIKN